MAIDLSFGRASLREAASARRRELAFESTLLDLFDATVVAWGERTAIDASDTVLDYDQLAAAADAVAGRLRKGGVGPGDRVAVRVPSGTADLYMAILGVLRAGAAYVPIDADDPAARAEQLIGEAKVCAPSSAAI